MSFDVFFQRFADGDARSGDDESMRACATCITSETRRVHLSAGLDEDVALVETGADLLRAIESS